MQPIADIIEAFGTVAVLMPSSRARRTRSVCVVALIFDIRIVSPPLAPWDLRKSFFQVVLYPNGSPTTRNATSTFSASCSISSLPVSTNSRSATMTGRP